jgi:NADPH:quinone reductase-like Zn-dependent oxidoreductase
MCEDRAMLAARIHEDGGPEVVVVEEAPDPVVEPGQVLVRLRAASLNHLDVWVRKGLPSVPKPRILGADGAGVVEAVGDGVSGFAQGDRVVLNPGLVHGDRVTVVGEHFDGTHAELIAIAAEQVFHLDDEISFETAAAFPLVYETAYRMLVTREAVNEGEWALIWGIGGGVATAAFEICRAFGVRTIVTSGSERKLAAARDWGADLALNHHTDDVVQAVKEATGRGADAVVETVGEATWSRSLAAVRPFGRVVVCGATTGPNPPAQLHRLWWKQLTLIGSTMGTREDFLGAYGLVRGRRVRVHVDSVFPLSEAAAAHARLESGEQLGKVVLAIPG